MSINTNIRKKHKEEFINRLGNLMIEFGVDTQMDTPASLLANYFWYCLETYQKLNSDQIMWEFKNKDNE